MSLSQYELAQIVEALDTIRKRLDALEAAQTAAELELELEGKGGTVPAGRPARS